MEAKCGICKERKMQGKINLNLQGKEIARNGIWREMESVRNGICKELNLQFAASGKKVVVFGKVRNLQATENASEEKFSHDIGLYTGITDQILPPTEL